VVGCLLAPVSVLAVWTANQVSSTSRYVASVEPLVTQFGHIWVQANTAVHQQLVKALSGQGGSVVGVSTGRVVLSLGPFINDLEIVLPIMALLFLAIGVYGEHAGLRTGPVGPWTYTHRRGLRISAVALAALLVVFAGQPDVALIFGIVAALLVALGLIELLGSRPPARPATL